MISSSEMRSCACSYLLLYASCQQTAKSKIRRKNRQPFQATKKNTELIAEPAFPYSVFRRLPARKNGQQSFYPLLPVHELTKACAFCPVNLYRLSCMAYLLFLLLKYCIAKTPPSTAMPMMSVRMVGSMRQRPPARRRRRSRIFALQ